MNKILSLALALPLLGLFGCASESQIKEAIRKNPKLIFEAIEEHPAEFMEAVNHAAQAAQRSQYEKQAQAMKTEQERDLKNPKKPELSADRRLSGNSNGPIVLVEYADFQCPACGMNYRTLKQFKQKYGDQVQFYFKDMPLEMHPMAHPAALYFEAIRKQGNAKALAFHNQLFEHQAEMRDDAFLKKSAKAVGADMKKLEKDIQTAETSKVVNTDMAEFEKFGFTGTPVIILNGVALQGAQPEEELERVVQLTQRKN